MRHIARRRQLAVKRSSVCIQAQDFVDYAEEKEVRTEDDVFSRQSASSLIASTVAYAFDVFSTAAVCYLLFDYQPFWWFFLTLIPFLSSLAIVNIFSLRWYLHDAEENKQLIGATSIGHWGLRYFFHGMLLGPVVRYLELFCYGVHSMQKSDPKREAYKVLVLQEDRDTSLLTLVGSIVKSAPQLVLQIYILVQNKRRLPAVTVHAEIVSVVTSIVTLSFAMASYHKALRRSIPSKLNMTPLGTGMQFLSHCCIIGCRVLTLAVFASVYGYWLFVLLTVHWTIMLLWLLHLKTSFCSTETGDPRHCDELWFNVVVALIYVFCFLNVKDEPTRWKYTFYYLLIWIENITLAILFYLNVDANVTYRLPLLLGVIFSFFVGLAILILYYRFFHPNKISRITTFVRTYDTM